VVVAITAAVFASVGTVAGEATGPTTISVKGSFDANASTAMPPDCLSPLLICTEATFTGTLSGTLKGMITRLVPAIDPADIAFASASSVLHTPDGDLSLKAAGTANLASSSDGEFANLLEITGGTGRYAGASGYLQDRGTSTVALLGAPATPFMASFHGDYVGKILLP